MDFPRPNLRRKIWQNLNGKWKFLFDDEAKYVHPRQIASWPHEILVPFAPECPKSGIGDTGFHTRLWYEQRFFLKRNPKKRYLLHFGAVDFSANVWVNDHYLGSHEGGHTPFAFDITAELADSDEFTVSVLAQDDPHDLAKPRGKQDWQLEPHSIWYPRTSGIWQTVWLEEVPEVYIHRVRWTPHLERWEIGFEVLLQGRVLDPFELTLELRLGNKLLVHDSYRIIENGVHRRIALSDPGIDDYRNEMLWSPERPTLLDAKITLSTESGAIIDEIESYTAMRSISILRD